MLPLFVLRPEPGCTATVAAARLRGLAAQGFPLFKIVPQPWDAPPPASFDALIVGSANAPRWAGAALNAYRGKPAYAVGETTAAALHAAGLAVIGTGSGGLQQLLEQLHPDHRRLLRLAGRERIALTPPPQVVLEERVVYASEAIPMPAALIAQLQDPAVIMLHSAEAARHYAAQAAAQGLPRAQLALACIGPRVAAAAGSGWAALRSTAEPGDTALLALAAEMCQTCDEREASA